MRPTDIILNAALGWAASDPRVLYAVIAACVLIGAAVQGGMP